MYCGRCLTCEARGPKTQPEVGRDGEVTIVEVEERAGGVSASYTGESGFSVAVRGCQHMEALKNPQSHGDNALVKHSSNYHKGEEAEVRYGLELVATSPSQWSGCAARVFTSTLTPQTWS